MAAVARSRGQEWYASRKRRPSDLQAGGPSDGPFPSDRFTELDKTQNTCQHVSLPVSLPAMDCASQPSECLERGMLNQFDGFNTKPRISIPFSGPIDLSTVDSTTVFLVALGNSVASGVPSCMLPPTGDEDEDDVLPAPDAGWVVGIDQGVWDPDPDTNTLYVEAAELLDQHTKYVVVVTRGVKDATGMPVAPAKAFKRAIGDEADDDAVILDSRVLAYEHALRVALKQLHYFGVRRHDIIAASVFTTMSVTAIAEKVRDQVNASPASAPASFALGPNGARTVFPLSSITGITFNRQTKTTGPLSSNEVTATTLPVLRLIPGAISTVAYGRYDSINYLDSNASMAPVATFSGTPTQRGASQVYFNVTIPSGHLRPRQRRQPPRRGFQGRLGLRVARYCNPVLPAGWSRLRPRHHLDRYAQRCACHHFPGRRTFLRPGRQRHLR